MGLILTYALRDHYSLYTIRHFFTDFLQLFIAVYHSVRALFSFTLKLNKIEKMASFKVYMEELE